MTNKIVIVAVAAVAVVAIIAAVVLTNGGNEEFEGEYILADYQILSYEDKEDNWVGKPVENRFIISSLEDGSIFGMFGDRQFSGVYDNNTFFFMSNSGDMGLNRIEATVGNMVRGGIIVTGISYIGTDGHIGTFQMLFTKDGTGKLPVFKNPFTNDDVYMSWHSRINTMNEALPAEEETLNVIRSEGNFAFIRIQEGDMPCMGCFGTLDNNMAIGIHVSMGIPWLSYITLMDGCIVSNSWKMIGSEPSIKVVCYSKDGQEVQLPEMPNMLGMKFANGDYLVSVVMQEQNIIRIQDTDGYQAIYIMIGAGDHFISISPNMSSAEGDQMYRGSAGFFSPDMGRVRLLPMNQYDAFDGKIVGLGSNIKCCDLQIIDTYRDVDDPEL